MSGATDQLLSDVREYTAFCAEIAEAKAIIKKIEEKRKKLEERIKQQLKQAQITSIATEHGEVSLKPKEKKESVNFDYLATKLEEALKCDSAKADSLAAWLLDSRDVTDTAEVLALNKPKRARAPKEYKRKRKEQ